MNSQINMLFGNKDVDNTEYIHIRGKRIPIYISNKGKSRGPRIEHIERFLRLHYELLDDKSLPFLANYLYHEVYACEEYDDFSLRIHRIFSSLKSIRIRIFEGEGPLMDEENAPAENVLAIRLLNNSSEPIYILLDCMDKHRINTEDFIQQRYRDNLKALLDLNPREKGIYYEAKSYINGKDNIGGINAVNTDDTSVRRRIDRATAALMVCYPMYIKVKQTEIVKKNLSKETSISRLYHENSKLRSFQLQGDFMLPMTEIDDEVKKVTARGRKTYPKHYKRIKLTSVNYSCGYLVEEVILRRRSRRSYSNSSVSLQKLSNILYYSYGITGKLEKRDMLLRAVPSVGGLYPIDIYISVNRVEGLDRGIYYYDPYEHEIVLVNHNDLAGIFGELRAYSKIPETAAFTFVLGASFWRNQWKYHERGYRAILIDCGHVAQNLHMLSTAYIFASCCLMDFLDDELDRLLELDGITEHSLYLISVGVNREE